MSAALENMTWRLLLEPQTPSAAYGVALDEALLLHSEVPILRLWVNQRCLVLGRFDVRLPRIHEAQRAFLQEKIPLIQRSSGGTAVWQDSGVFNVSVIVPTSLAPHGVHATFEVFAEGMAEGLKKFGLDVRFGQIPGTYCDGPHNLVVSGKKIAGLAQVRRRVGSLVHAGILIDVDKDEMHNQIEKFYRLARTPKTFARDRVTTLKQELGAAWHFDALTNAFVAGYSQLGIELKESVPSSAERRDAQQLADKIWLISGSK